MNVVLPILFTIAAALPDDFDRLEGPPLAGAAKGEGRAALTLGEIAALPNVLKGVRSSLVVVETDQGNLGRLLVSPALRKAPGGKGDALPVMVIERFDTFQGGGATAREAKGKDIVLFDGFQVDLDTGNVVPEGQGGDLQYRADAPAGPRLVAVMPSKMFTLDKAPLPPEKADASRLTPGRQVRPTDFLGKFRLFANGQWSGTLVLKDVNGKGDLSGEFVSDQTGTSYPVKGQAGVESTPARVKFTVRFPRVNQEYDGLLWAEGKGAMAGTVTLLDRAFGFFALREGGTFAPEGINVESAAEKGGKGPGRKVLTVKGDGMYSLDGFNDVDPNGLVEALKAAVANDPALSVTVRASSSLPYSALSRALDDLKGAGVTAVRLETAAEGGAGK